MYSPEALIVPGPLRASPPLTFQVMQSKEARSILDYGAAVPPHLNAGWIATDKLIKEEYEVLDTDGESVAGGPSRKGKKGAAVDEEDYEVV